jgi:hypothetical protein
MSAGVKVRQTSVFVPCPLVRSNRHSRWGHEGARMDPAAHAQAEIDAWHRRLAAGGSARSSPTIATAIAAEYERLDVYCEGCRYKVEIPWPLMRRPPDTPLVDLVSDLTCRRCGPRGPLPKILGVRRQRDAPPFLLCRLAYSDVAGTAKARPLACCSLYVLISFMSAASYRTCAA